MVKSPRETSIRGIFTDLHGCLIFMVFIQVNIQSSHGWYGIWVLHPQNIQEKCKFRRINSPKFCFR